MAPCSSPGQNEGLSRQSPPRLRPKLRVDRGERLAAELYELVLAQIEVTVYRVHRALAHGTGAVGVAGLLY